MIILGVKDEQRLFGARKFLVESGIQHCHFYEPDIGDELTALATEPVVGGQRKLFRKFQLLRSKGGA